MHDLAVQAHRVRNEFSSISNKQYDKQTCTHLIEQIQSMALGIANDTQGDEIKTANEISTWTQMPSTPRLRRIVWFSQVARLKELGSGGRRV